MFNVYIVYTSAGRNVFNMFPVMNSCLLNPRIHSKAA